MKLSEQTNNAIGIAALNSPDGSTLQWARARFDVPGIIRLILSHENNESAQYDVVTCHCL